MSFAKERTYVRAARQLPSMDSLEEVRLYMQEQLDAIHELNARVFFLQEQLAVLSAATSIPIDTLEDY